MGLWQAQEMDGQKKMIEFRARASSHDAGREPLGNDALRNLDKTARSTHLHPLTLDHFPETTTLSSMGVSIIDAQRDSESQSVVSLFCF